MTTKNNSPFASASAFPAHLIADALEGRTTIDETMRLMSVKSPSTFDK